MKSKLTFVEQESGLGKTRFGFELLHLLKRLDIPGDLGVVLKQRCWYTFIDFNGDGDAMTVHDTDPATAMAVRLLARGLFDLSTKIFECSFSHKRRNW